MGGRLSKVVYVGSKIDANQCKSAITAAKSLAEFFVHLKKGKVTLADAGTYEIKECADLGSKYSIGQLLGTGKYGSAYAACTRVDKPDCSFVVKFQTDCLAFAREVTMYAKLDGSTAIPVLYGSYVCPDAKDNRRYGIVIDRMEARLWDTLKRDIVSDATTDRLFIEPGFIIDLLGRFYTMRKDMYDHGVVYVDWHMLNVMQDVKTTQDWKVIDLGLARAAKESTYIPDFNIFSTNILVPLALMATVGVTYDFWQVQRLMYGDINELDTSPGPMLHIAMQQEQDYLETFGRGLRLKQEDPSREILRVVGIIKKRMHTNARL